MSKLAILQMADTPQVESSTLMLRCAGYEVKVCGPEVREELKRIGCDTVVSVESAWAYGCDRLDPSILQADLRDIGRCDLWCDIKVNNLAKVWERWPHLKGKTAFWRVNGGRPEHVIRTRGGRTEDCGDEMRPGCPVISANFWYGSQGSPPSDSPPAYTFYPPYPRMADYSPSRRNPVDPPFCLCHGVEGWGFKDIVPACREMGVQIYGHGCPGGPLVHSLIPDVVAKGLAMVHIKGSDCPGWALYEALLGACPVIVSQYLVCRGLYQALYRHQETCFIYGVAPNEFGRGDPQFDRCRDEIRYFLLLLKESPDEAKRVGLAGREALIELMWRADRDGPEWVEFLERNFNG